MEDKIILRTHGCKDSCLGEKWLTRLKSKIIIYVNREKFSDNFLHISSLDKKNPKPMNIPNV